MRKSFVLLSLLLLLTTPVISSLPLDVTAQDTLSIKIITPHPEGIRVEYEAAFDAYYFSTKGSHVDIEYIDVGGTSDIVSYVNAAYAANNEETCRIDIWWGGGVDPFIDQKRRGHLYSYKISDATLNDIPADISGIPMYDKDYTWYGTALSGFGIIYNKVVLQTEKLPVPKTWEDLTNPSLRGWVGSADPRNSGSTHMMYEIMFQAYGWEKAMRTSTMLGANVKSWPTSSSAVPKSVSAGEVAYGLAIDFYAWSEISLVGADKVGYVIPEGLSVINPDSIAILKGAPNLELSKAFVEYTLSRPGQKLLMLPKGDPEGPKQFLLGRMCMIPALYTELQGKTIVPVNPFAVKSVIKYNETLGSLRYVLLNDLIGATIIDTHKELISVWSEINGVNQTLSKAGVTSTKINDAINKMGSAPLGESDATKLAGSWGDAAIRNKYLTDWRTFALKKYDEASDLAKLAATDMLTYFQGIINRLESDKNNNLYMGLGGGAVVGIVIGFALAYYITRRKEIAAVKA